MNKKYYVYKITNLINNKIYIGKSSSHIDRFKTHLKIAKYKHKNSCSYLHKSINKYGKENFLFEIIEYYETENEAYAKEIEYIALYKSNQSEFGMNLTSGGAESWRVNKEVVDKIAAKNKGRKASQETIERLKVSHLGIRSATRKFSDNEAIQIRYEYLILKKNKIKQPVEILCKKYEVSYSCINHLVSNTGKSYKNAKKSSLEEVTENIIINELKKYFNNDNLVKPSEISFNYKICSRCKVLQAKNNFQNTIKNSDGLNCRCRDCDKEVKEISILKKNPKLLENREEKKIQVEERLIEINKKIEKRKKKYKGISYYGNKKEKFIARINDNNGKTIKIGIFITEKDAAIAYDQKAIELFGRKAKVNFPENYPELDLPNFDEKICCICNNKKHINDFSFNESRCKICNKERLMNYRKI